MGKADCEHLDSRAVPGRDRDRSPWTEENQL
ncbi:predicted protein [Streptomyces albidoflavus]|nr:hypothetical protein SFR_3506 [Streptomyces sp. FR-008]EFE82597.1 predicted protein [Streptomyces albidoflavus]